MVRRYQTDNKLNVDGKCGKTTMASMIIKIKKGSEIPNYENISFDPEEILRAQQAVIKAMNDAKKMAETQINVKEEVKKIEESTIKRLESIDIDFSEIDTEGLFREWQVMVDTTKNK
jgi:hypothetical protein